MKLLISRTMKRKGHLLELLRARDPSTFLRTIQKKGIFKKSAVYYLNVDLNVTRVEMKLLKENRTWEYEQVCRGNFFDRSWDLVNLGDILGKKTRWAFETLEFLENFERGLIDGLKRLKERLEGLTMQDRQQVEHAKRLKQQAAEFTPEGPHEAEL